MQKKNMQEIWQTIRAKPEMRAMLESVYTYNLSFCSSAEEKNRLATIIKAMAVVDRVFFVPPQSKRFCYEDYPLDIGKGQTISQPSTVARMLFLARLEKNLKVLEIGAGSGWNAALIAYLVRPGKVVSIDRIGELIERAKDNIQRFVKSNKKRLNLEFRVGNPFEENDKVWRENYDRIIITAGITHNGIARKTERLATLLRDKGILIAPFTYGPLLIYEKSEGKLKKRFTQEHYQFVPILGGVE